MFWRTICRVLYGTCALILVYLGVRMMLVGMEFLTFKSQFEGIFTAVLFVIFLAFGSMLEDICEEC